jgi:hypothetical protein
MSSYNPSGMSSSALTTFAIFFIVVVRLPILSLITLTIAAFRSSTGATLVFFAGGSLVTKDVTTEYVAGDGEAF